MKKIIHRGITSNLNKDNSFLAIREALLKSDNEGVEFDIRLTKDQKIVLSHDSLVDGIIVEKENYTSIIKKKYLCTLDRILGINTDKILLIDIKVNNNYKLLADTLLNTINNSKRNIYLASFNKKIVKYLKKKTYYKSAPITFFYFRNNYPFIMNNYHTIKEKRLSSAKKKEIFLWTVHNEHDMKEVKEKFLNNSNYYVIADEKKR